MKRKIFAVLIVATLLASVGSVASAQPESRSYLLITRNNKLPAKLAQQVGAVGGSLTRTIPEVGIAVVASNNPNFVADASSIRGVQSVVPNVTLQWTDPTYQEAVTLDTSNPPDSGDDDFFFDLQWGHDAVDAPEAWDAGARGTGVRVAVLDTGFDLDHPDLAPNIDFDSSEDFTGEGLNWTRPDDPFSHGTHTAGTIAAADNAFGTIGVAPEAELVLVKVLGDAGSGTFADVIAGIVYAAAVAEADVINMSLGAPIPQHGYYDEDEDVWVGANEIAELTTALGRATTYAYQQGVTVIASAGNDANDGDHDKDLLHLPSDCPNVISISATGPLSWALDPSTDLDVPAYYTNYGQSVIDFAAPGGNVDFGLIPPDPEPLPLCTVAGLTRPCYVFDFVFSTGSMGSWYWSVGTSMAAPHVSGVAAIIIGQNGGDMHPAQVEAALRASADDLGKPGNDDFYGLGRVNAGSYVK